jgi:hypothetical protein
MYPVMAERNANIFTFFPNLKQFHLFVSKTNVYNKFECKIAIYHSYNIFRLFS